MVVIIGDFLCNPFLINSLQYLYSPPNPGAALNVYFGTLIFSAINIFLILLPRKILITVDRMA
jgi:hypothetical protein